MARRKRANPYLPSQVRSRLGSYFFLFLSLFFTIPVALVTPHEDMIMIMLVLNARISGDSGDVTYSN